MTQPLIYTTFYILLTSYVVSLYPLLKPVTARWHKVQLQVLHIVLFIAIFKSWL